MWPETFDTAARVEQQLGGRRIPTATDGALSQKDAALAEAVHKHADTLSRRALWLTRCRTEAADLCQETWERAFRRAHRHADTEVTLRWLLTIMHNSFLDHRRAEVVRRTLPGGSGALERIEQKDQLLEPWRTVEDELLRLCIGRLSTTMKQAIELHLAGVPYGEIAARSGVGVATVGTRLFRARRRLREMLRAAGVRED